MLQLKNIVKHYTAGDSEVEALKGVSISFRKNEFVSILGPSGCGKTTMLNIIGGLDRYTSGDLIINGRSTKEYKDSDWDTYRNHSIGFVFQSYNLIPHQTVLSNVELALTLSGVSKTERRKRAVEALKKVGLGDQIHKKPNQMSGGQMQRVAIARALVNDPDILLADEPTGALDTVTSVQIMDLLKEISKDKLIIMVTHNRELAEEYSSRIISLLDGEVTDDTMHYSDEEVEKDLKAEKAELKKGKKSMSFFTALSLSFNNLMTKRGRTILTAFAGSIGIIGIALILAMSTGIQAYIDEIQRDTLSSYPLTIEAQQADLSSVFASMAPTQSDATDGNHGTDAVYSNSSIYELFNAVLNTEVYENDMESFKKYLDKELVEETSESGLYNYVSSIQYLYTTSLNMYVKGPDGEYVNTDMTDSFSAMADNSAMGEMMSNNMMTQFSALNLWEEMLPGKDGELISDLIYEQFDLIHGKWPEKANEVVLILSKNNEISDLAFYALGLMSDKEIQDIMMSVMKQETVEVVNREISYEDVLDISFKLLTDPDYYTDSDGDGIWTDIRDNHEMLEMVINSAQNIEIVGIIRPNEDATATLLSGTFGYTSALTELVIEKVSESEIVKQQSAKENENYDVFTGLPFIMTEALDPTDGYKAEEIKKYFDSLSADQKAELYLEMASVPTEEYVSTTLETYMEMYDTREKIEEMISTSYGMALEEIKSYLDSYSDEELNELLRTNLTEMIKMQYASEVEKQVEGIKTTPSESELAELMGRITERLTTREMKIGYVMQNWSAITTMDQNSIGAYLFALPDEALNEAVNSVAVKSAAELYTSLAGDMYADTANEKVAAMFDKTFGTETDIEILAQYYDNYMPSTVSGSTLSDNLKKLGVVDKNKPSLINIYAMTFEDKDTISSLIEEYNADLPEDERINYTDYVALLMSGITTIIDAISYGLIIFVSVSLVVSSIMIGIITYISVLERTKEIGILRSIGASKRDISLVFNAETMIVGFTSGLMGIGLSLLLCIPINFIVHTLTGINSLSAYLEPMACVILVAISVGLTLIAGLIPSGFAAKKDPVEALRTE
ncbi:MAG: ABC transporter ATP-binding protein/permease [Ruminococcaceae bacterium]|nr:ABC transporter ATP-binding protein/permease [Oscillospiraceae bacterium]